MEQRQSSSAGEATINGLVQVHNNQEYVQYRTQVLKTGTLTSGQRLLIIAKETYKVVTTTVTPETSQTSATLTPRIISPVLMAVSVPKETGLKMTSSSVGSADNTPVPMDQVHGAGSVLHLKSSVKLPLPIRIPTLKEGNESLALSVS